MNWILFLIILFMPQNGDTKDYVVNISKTERIKVKVDTVCEPILPSSKLKYAIYLAGEIKTINVKIWNYTNHNLTFIILHNPAVRRIFPQLCEGYFLRTCEMRSLTAVTKFM